MARWRPAVRTGAQHGVSTIEYALLLAGIAAVIFLVVTFGFRQTLQNALSGFVDNFSQMVNNGTGGGAGGGGTGGGGGGLGGSPSPSPTATATP